MSSTHPAPKKRSKLKWLMLGLALVVAGVGLKMGVGGKNGVTYKLSEVARGDIKMTILSTGVVSAENRLDLKAPVTGRIEKITVEEGQHVIKGQILAWMSSTERAALIDTAQSKGPEELAYWEKSYKMTPILAPTKGVIILKSLDAGTTVTQTDTILSMSDRLIVKANVDETDLAQVRLGQPVETTLDAFPDSVLESKVIHIGYDSKTVSNVTTYEVDILALHTPRFMKSGMTANVSFLIAEKKNTLFVPATAVHRTKHKSFVMVPDAANPNEPAQKEVKVGISDGKRVEILDGMAEGDQLLSASLRSLAKKPENNESPFSPFGSKAPTRR